MTHFSVARQRGPTTHLHTHTHTHIRTCTYIGFKRVVLDFFEIHLTNCIGRRQPANSVCKGYQIQHTYKVLEYHFNVSQLATPINNLYIIMYTSVKDKISHKWCILYAYMIPILLYTITQKHNNRVSFYSKPISDVKARNGCVHRTLSPRAFVNL